MSKTDQREVDQLLQRVRELEREVRTLREETSREKRGFAEVALAALETGDTAAPALGAVTAGEQTIAGGVATILEVVNVGGTLKLKPIQNSTGGNFAKINYLNASDNAPQMRASSAAPVLLTRLRDGKWIRFPAGSLQNTNAELFYFTLTANLAATVGATATATAFAANALSGPTTAITVRSPGRFRAFTGAIGLALKVREAGVDAYWILVVDQPALEIFVTLNAHPIQPAGSPRYGADPREVNAAFKSTPAPRALTPFPFNWLPDLTSGLLPNPLKLFGENGDTAIFTWDPSTDTYFLSEVFPQRQQSLWGTIATTRPNGLAQVISCTPVTPSSHGAFPAAPFNATDAYNVAIHGRLDSVNPQKLLLRWNAAEATYHIVASQHTANWIKGTVASAFVTTDPTFFVAVAANHGLDGIDDVGTLTVDNVFKWSGAAGKQITVQWDTHLGKYRPVQMEYSC